MRTTIGENIGTYRTALGWSQEKLAVRAGLSLNFIGNLERGKVNVSVETLETLSRPLGVETEILLKNL